MFFKRLQKKFLFLTRNKTHQKHNKFTTHRINFDKEKSESLALEKVGNLILKKKYKQGLKFVNTTIESGIISQQLLAKKAYLLSQNKKYDEAHAIWDKLSKNKNKPKLAESAKQSLNISRIQQGESFAAVKKDNQARKIWADLCRSENKSIAKKACQLIAKSLSDEALQISSTKSPKEAISYFIEEHLKLKLAPTLNNDITDIIKKHEPSNTKYSHPELQEYQFQLKLNTMVIELLEDKLHK